LTVAELSRRTGIGARRLRRLIAEGALPAYSAASSRRRVLWSDFLAWLRSTRVQTPPGAAEHAERRVAEILERERSLGR
jgi:excisionase family DNA binding protein